MSKPTSATLRARNAISVVSLPAWFTSKRAQPTSVSTTTAAAQRSMRTAPLLAAIATHGSIHTTNCDDRSVANVSVATMTTTSGTPSVTRWFARYHQVLAMATTRPTQSSTAHTVEGAPRRHDPD